MRGKSIHGRLHRMPPLVAIGLASLAAGSGFSLVRVLAAQPAPASQPQNHAELSPTEPQEAAATQPAESVEPAGQRLVSGLIGSAHDFTRLGYGRDLCLPCHTPHQAFSEPPLLDRRGVTPLPLRPYQAGEVVLTGWSLLCLGCHDGITASDVYSSPHATTVAAQINAARFGAPGLRSHPVGVRQPDTAEKYYPPEAVEAAGLPLVDGRIQCTTCHDAHNTHGYSHMLRNSNQGSRLCLTCHRL